MRSDSPSDNLASARELSSLTLFAQTLVACRLSRRTVLAMLDGVEREIAQRACEVIETISQKGI